MDDYRYLFYSFEHKTKKEHILYKRYHEWLQEGVFLLTPLLPLGRRCHAFSTLEEDAALLRGFEKKNNYQMDLTSAFRDYDTIPFAPLEPNLPTGYSNLAQKWLDM